MPAEQAYISPFPMWMQKIAANPNITAATNDATNYLKEYWITGFFKRLFVHLYELWLIYLSILTIAFCIDQQYKDGWTIAQLGFVIKHMHDEKTVVCC